MRSLEELKQEFQDRLEQAKEDRKPKLKSLRPGVWQIIQRMKDAGQLNPNWDLDKHGIPITMGTFIEDEYFRETGERLWEW